MSTPASENRKWWTPKPGEPWSLTVVSNWPPVDYAEIETRIILTAPWNTPHVCTHEGPWTLNSCDECDYNEARALVAFFAWLADDQKTLELIRPRPEMYCMHANATRYAPCQSCREILHRCQIEPSMHERAIRRIRGMQRARSVDIDAIRRTAKRVNFGDALGPYGVPYGKIA